MRQIWGGDRKRLRSRRVIEITSTESPSPWLSTVSVIVVGVTSGAVVHACCGAVVLAGLTKHFRVSLREGQPVSCIGGGGGGCCYPAGGDLPGTAGVRGNGGRRKLQGADDDRRPFLNRRLYR
jgi:hypothetical protein